jgi:hypothetical protein
VVEPPTDGIWRVGRGTVLDYPERSPIDMSDARSGNRFDSFTGRYSVLYFGTTRTACYGETLSRFRRDPKLAFLDDEWDGSAGFMKRGTVPADWRTRRTAVQVKLPAGSRFLDVEDAGSRSLLEREIGPALAMLGCPELDVAAIRGADRRVTRFISEWAWQQDSPMGDRPLAGIRYLSRMDTDWECWAVFDDWELEEVARLPILLSDLELQAVARRYELTVF